MSSEPFQTLFLRLISYQLRQDSLASQTFSISVPVPMTNTGSDRRCSETNPTVCKHKQEQMQPFSKKHELMVQKSLINTNKSDVHMVWEEM